MRKRNFTFLELVVVIVAVFLMACLVMSTMTKIANASKNAACKANLKKFATALQQYSNDNDGFLPFPGINWIGKDYGKYSGSYLSNKVPSKNVESFVCPADERKMNELQAGGSKFWMKTPAGKWTHYKVSYGINLVVTGVPKNQYWKPHRLTTMKVPEKCYIFSDGTIRDNPGDVKRFAFRHEDKANIAYADGHIGELTKDKIPAWKSHLKQTFWVGADK